MVGEVMIVIVAKIATAIVVKEMDAVESVSTWVTAVHMVPPMLLSSMVLDPITVEIAFVVGVNAQNANLRLVSVVIH